MPRLATSSRLPISLLTSRRLSPFFSLSSHLLFSLTSTMDFLKQAQGFMGQQGGQQQHQQQQGAVDPNVQQQQQQQGGMGGMGGMGQQQPQAGQATGQMDALGEFSFICFSSRRECSRVIRGMECPPLLLALPALALPLASFLASLQSLASPLVELSASLCL
ncbi:hypothetical protein CC85DRAFT_65624 [Cutaneotrichosporon oleaginosum]|uniref:Uncharacterized protein n=1 Tax=Cutaneotrichosporon oleaginosum TaxID=879819 RepID=A0A0J0XQ27_9TREE|nr:uncharacterized protein CC85DRAFT_65624 [Cutaneotrichosporon oleaginosum]KLT43226.1 hypothetical protein CC85DRAFT_65624 [Cutaneotrichosporon oleaginosum]